MSRRAPGADSCVAARLRLERMRLRAQRKTRGAGELNAEEDRLFQTRHRRVRRFIGCGELGRIGFGGGRSASFAFGTIRHRLETWTHLA